MSAPPARRLRLVTAATAALAVCCPMVAAADQVCPAAPNIAVETDDPALTDLACSAAASALDLLRPCGLDVQPDLQISVVETLGETHMACLADYDCELNRIRVLSPTALTAMAETGSAFSVIPPETLFASLVAHELAHAALEEASAPERLPTLSHEFIAYSVQIASLPEMDRARFLATDAASVDGPTDGLVNPFILMMAPDLFAASAYQQISPDRDLCNWVDRVLSGDEGFLDVFEF